MSRDIDIKALTEHLSQTWSEQTRVNALVFTMLDQGETTSAISQLQPLFHRLIRDAELHELMIHTEGNNDALDILEHQIEVALDQAIGALLLIRYGWKENQ